MRDCSYSVRTGSSMSRCQPRELVKYFAIPGCENAKLRFGLIRLKLGAPKSIASAFVRGRFLRTSQEGRGLNRADTLVGPYVRRAPRQDGCLAGAGDHVVEGIALDR